MDPNNNHAEEENLEFMDEGEIEGLFPEGIVELVEKDLELSSIFRSFFEDSIHMVHQEGDDVLATQHFSHGNVLNGESPWNAELPESSSNSSPGVSELYLQVIVNDENNKEKGLMQEQASLIKTDDAAKNKTGTKEN